MIKIPYLPFASSITGGEHHACIKPMNEVVFNVHYYAKLYEHHNAVIVQFFTERFAKELLFYADAANQDLVKVMFDILMQQAKQGVLSFPTTTEGKSVVVTLAYVFDLSAESLDVVVSFIANSEGENIDRPTIAFSVEYIPNKSEWDDYGIAFTPDVLAPYLLMTGKSIEQCTQMAFEWVKLICAYEIVMAYHCIPFKAWYYKAMSTKNGIELNPNFVDVNCIALADEKVDA